MLKLVRLTRTLVVCALPFLGGLALAAGPVGEKLSNQDRTFIKEAAQAGIMEAQAGKLAADRATSERVKEFGIRMEQDHTKANVDVGKLAAEKGVKLPNKLDGKQKSTIDHISGLPRDRFDREYMQTMINGHTQDVAAFEREISNGNDLDVKQFASRHLPTVQKHLDLAKTAAGQLQAASSNTAEKH